jgi:quercetin dioxygenase-like cupin family protein
MSAESNWRGYKLNRTQTVKTAVLAIAIAAGTVGAQPAVAQQPQADLPGDWTGDTKVIVLSKSDLPGGKEATTFMTEIPPEASTPRHYHPGQELAYVLEGTGVMHELGKPSMPIKLGFTVSAYSPPDKPAYVHWASNTSKTDIQRWLITVVTPKGYPIR